MDWEICSIIQEFSAELQSLIKCTRMHSLIVTHLGSGLHTRTTFIQVATKQHDVATMHAYTYNTIMYALAVANTIMIAHFKL